MYTTRGQKEDKDSAPHPDPLFPGATRGGTRPWLDTHSSSHETGELVAQTGSCPRIFLTAANVKRVSS